MVAAIAMGSDADGRRRQGDAGHDRTTRTTCQAGARSVQTVGAVELCRSGPLRLPRADRRLQSGRCVTMGLRRPLRNGGHDHRDDQEEKDDAQRHGISLGI
jgi:hypothetical protein